MGFFSKLFGSDDAPAKPEPAAEPSTDAPPATETTPGGPYRGGEFVVAKPELPVAPRKQPEPMWDSWTEVFALELGDNLPLRSLVYCGETQSDRYAVRRVVFAEGGVILDWELELPNRDALSNHLACRVDDRVIVPRAKGVVAVHVVTGETCWELPHPSVLMKRPMQFRDGDLFLAFEDQSWMRVAPRDGATRAEGTVRSDRDLEEVKRECRDISPRLRADTRYGKCRVKASSDKLEVVADGTKTAPPDPPGPTVGEYPIDEWAPKTWIALAGDRLAVLLRRSWNNRTRAAVGIFEPTSLEPLRLLELADVKWHCDCEARLIDDLLAIQVEVESEDRGYNAMFVVDAHAERVLACFVENKPSHLFDGEGERIWTSPL